MDEKSAGGRPTLYKPEYCAALIEHMANGFSYESFAGHVSVSKQTIYDWEKANPEFLDAKEVAFAKAQVFWEKLGIDYVVNTTETSGSQKDRVSISKSLNASVWIFNMKNRFQWRDKQPDEIDTVINNTNNVGTKSDEEIDARLKELLPKASGE